VQHGKYNRNPPELPFYLMYKNLSQHSDRIVAHNIKMINQHSQAIQRQTASKSSPSLHRSNENAE
jgi:hypothetical protein